ncbi:MAG: exosortase A [Candidatus Andeanibacterium colombiense]|uniref:Exosortase A n=1 Tax=Candidatus Andeanibacterium colombiense TaxID=3121345 RepID=A0AAJ6BPQ7_9SPHN|nr:MAG: exosortase A [Sphingomonadaceae bacterium]
MPPEAVLPPSLFTALTPRIPQAWRVPLAQLALAWTALIAWFGRDWADMAGQWWNSSTYNHIVLVPAILAWLAWQRAAELRRLDPAAWWPGLLLVTGALFLWLLGAISGLNLARQLGAVMVLQGAAVTLLGPRVSGGLLFPLAYMLFLVPFGDELIPLLQTVTAKLTIGMIHLSGVRAAIDGVFIDTPVGLFEVAEACSGVKFLIAMLALGVLVAQVCFRSWRRRVAFMIAAAVLPILANGVRAWGTIFIAQSQGVRFAEGFDHIFYGWVFFGVVMALLLAGSWRFFDRAVDDPLVDVARIEASPVLARLEQMRMGGWPAVAAIAALALLACAWALRAATLAAPMPATIALPEVPGWHRADYRPQVWWEPRAQGADHRLLGRYRDGAGHEVDVFYALYAAQGEGREAGGFGEGALSPDTRWRWEKPGPAVADAQSEVLFAGGEVHRLAATFYRTSGLLTGSNSELKLANMRDRLLMRARPTGMLILSGEEGGAHPAADSIAAFRAATGPTGAWMDGIGQVP